MIKKRTLISAAAAIIVTASLAWAANTVFFTSKGDLTFPFSPPTSSGTAGTIDNMTIGGSTPQAGTFTTVTANLVNATLGSYANNPASTTYYPAYTFANGQTQLLFAPTTTVSYAYVTFASAPKDGQQACIFSTQTITDLRLLAPGQTIASAVTTLSANTRVCYLYSLANTTWNRSN